MKNQIENFDKLINKIDNLNINDKDKQELINLTNDIKNKYNKKTKKDKDPDAPKRPKNGFMLFMDDVRKIKDNKKHSAHFPVNRLDDVKNIVNNNESITELSKSCGIFWKEAKDDEKNKYQNAYKKAQDKYKKDIEKYKNDKND